ncbi:hypothetical protein BDK51DRAFT_49612 [Blyttiomyces helicus]|uniref:Uncharacterized protein n=1 Tax=Blyttiomyces helicus TaxID=388810 RepID=A0A4V1ISK3_9FUNG|nr:hypothetical protein BDK51DRAFT_49612 [Blyttiomyces helicus]|eukprot:RKO93857.1 hypothetical protein BDK51DRAFT_49612 [Blyttiomyces helicus]
MQPQSLATGTSRRHPQSTVSTSRSTSTTYPSSPPRSPTTGRAPPVLTQHHDHPRPRLPFQLGHAPVDRWACELRSLSPPIDYHRCPGNLTQGPPPSPYANTPASTRSPHLNRRRHHHDQQHGPTIDPRTDSKVTITSKLKSSGSGVPTDVSTPIMKRCSSDRKRKEKEVPLQSVGGRAPLRRIQPGVNLLTRTGFGGEVICNHKVCNLQGDRSTEACSIVRNGSLNAELALVPIQPPPKRGARVTHDRRLQAKRPRADLDPPKDHETVQHQL